VLARENERGIDYRGAVVAMNVSGDNAQQLEQKRERILRFDHPRRRVGPTRFYGLDRLLRAFLGLPARVPLYVHMDHGVPLLDEMLSAERETRLPVFFTRSSRRRVYEELTGRPAHVVGSPFVHYRRSMGIERAPGARGTVVFPMHSTSLLDVVFDWDRYAESLLSLPEHLQPITVCLYWKDLLAGAHQAFTRRGLPVTTAGHRNDPRFVEHFYAILRRAQYTTGNVLGSNTFYSVEMGIPYFTYGAVPEQHNTGGHPDYPSGRFDLRETSPEVLELQRVFTFEPGASIRITDATRSLVHEKLGIDEDIDKHELRRVVYDSLVRNAPRDLLSRVRRRLGRR
jgi:hypothetical protein